MLTRGEEINLRKTRRRMRYACAAGIVLGMVTTTITAIVLLFVEGGAVTVNGVKIDAFTSLDAALFFVLSFFICWRKSMFAAVMMFAFYLADTLHMWYHVAIARELPGVGTVLLICVGLPFLYWFFEGARGAVVYRGLQRKRRRGE